MIPRSELAAGKQQPTEVSEHGGSGISFSLLVHPPTYQPAPHRGSISHLDQFLTVSGLTGTPSPVACEFTSVQPRAIGKFDMLSAFDVFWIVISIRGPHSSLRWRQR